MKKTAFYFLNYSYFINLLCFRTGRTNLRFADLG